MRRSIVSSEERPTLALAPGEFALGAALLVLLLGVGAADCAGALLARSSLLSFPRAAEFLLRALRHPGAAVSAWPHSASPNRGPAFPAWCFWSLSAVIVAIPVGVSWWLFARRRGLDDGFASATAIRREATLRSARRLARTTRLSLRGERSPALREVGYPLGGTVAPRGRFGRAVPLVCSWEHSLQLVAPPGAGKTLRVLAPILRQHPGPVLATSTKSDLYEISATARLRVGPVLALDPDGLCPAAPPLRWSPVAGCEDAQVATRRASALVAAAGDGSDLRSGAFFRRSATTVLAAYLHAAALDGASMRDVVRWTARPRDPAPLRVLATRGDRSVDWGARLHAHTSGAEETTSGVMRSVDLALACFSEPSVLAQCSPTTEEASDLEQLLAENATVFALGKDRGALGGSGPLVTAFSDELLAVAERRATRMAGRRLDPPLLACLDEAASIAPLPALPALVADGRGRGIVTLVALQSFSQAEARWGREGAQTIRNAASVLVVFGGLSVASDLDELSRLCGTRQIGRTTLSLDRDGRPSSSRQFVEDAVLAPSALRALEEGTALVLLGRLPPLLASFPGIWVGRNGKRALAEEALLRAANDAARSEETRPNPREGPTKGDHQ